MLRRAFNETKNVLEASLMQTIHAKALFERVIMQMKNQRG
jgi:hypothetical protein